MVTAAAYLLAAVLFGCNVFACSAGLALWRMLEREATAHARTIDAKIRRDSECSRMRLAAIDREAAMADLRSDIALCEEQLAELGKRAALSWLPSAVSTDSRPVIH